MLFFFFKQKTAYELRISDWSSDVCSSDLGCIGIFAPRVTLLAIVGEAAFGTARDVEYGKIVAVHDQRLVTRGRQQLPRLCALDCSQIFCNTGNQDRKSVV